MLRLLTSEYGKISHKHILVLLFLSPLMVGAIAFVAPIMSTRSPSWDNITEVTFALWFVFLLPLTAASFATMQAQIEYRGGAWDYVLALPVPRWQLYAAKIIVAVTVLVLTCALVLPFTIAFGLLADALGRPITGEIYWLKYMRVSMLLTASSVLMISLQAWAAHRSRLFVNSLGFGIAGTFVSLACVFLNSDKLFWWPWFIPSSVLRHGYVETHTLVFTSLAVAAFVWVFMIIDLSRHEMR